MQITRTLNDKLPTREHTLYTEKGIISISVQQLQNNHRTPVNEIAGRQIPCDNNRTNGRNFATGTNRCITPTRCERFHSDKTIHSRVRENGRNTNAWNTI